MDAEGVPYEHLDGPEITRRWPQWRLGDEHHGLYQADVRPRRPEPRQRRPPAARPGERRDAPRPLPGDAAAATAGGEVEVRTADGTIHRAAHGRHRRRRLDERAAAALRPAAAADDHEGAGDVLRLAGSRRPSPRIASRSGSGWTSPCFYGFPTYGEAGPEGRPGRRWRRDDAGDADVRPRRGRRSTDSRDFLAGHLPGAARPADLHEDVPLHADARIATSSSTALPGRPERPRRPRGGPRATSSRRSSAGSSPSWRSTGRRRRRARSSASGSTGRSSSRRRPRRASWSDATMTENASDRHPQAAPPPPRRHRRDRRAGQPVGEPKRAPARHRGPRGVGAAASSSATTSTTATATWPVATRTVRGSQRDAGGTRRSGRSSASRAATARPRLIPLLDRDGVRREPEGAVRLHATSPTLHLAGRGLGRRDQRSTRTGRRASGAHEVTDFSKETLRAGAVLATSRTVRSGRTRTIRTSGRSSAGGRRAG